MWFWIGASALAAPDASVALSVTSPAGETLFDDEIAVGKEQRFELVDGKHVWRLVLSTSVTHGGVLLAARLLDQKGGSVKERAATEVQPAEAEEARLTLGHDKLAGAYEVRAAWAQNWSPGPVGPLPSGKSRYAVVWVDASLLEHPRQPETATQRAELPSGRNDPSGQTSPYKVVHAWGTSHLEVERVDQPLAEHCYVGAPTRPEDPYQHYVSVDDLLLVTTRELSATFEDGSGYTVAAGVALTPLDGDLYEARVGDLRFPITVPDPESIGTRYRPSALFSVAEAGWTLTPGDDGELGSTPLGAVRWTGEEPPVVQGRKGVRDPIVIVRDRCAEVRLRVDGRRLTTPRADAPGDR